MAMLCTIGHSTRTLSEFIGLMKASGVRQVVDIRTIPRSRYTPQFNTDNLAEELPMTNLAYVHLAALGGLRKVQPGSANDGWRNKSFRGYADYMQTNEFRQGLHQLRQLAEEKTSAIMCAEAVPWRCHRNLVADAMTVRGWEVRHIISAAAPKEHILADFAFINGTTVTYPATCADTS